MVGVIVGGIVEERGMEGQREEGRAEGRGRCEELGREDAGGKEGR